MSLQNGKAGEGVERQSRRRKDKRKALIPRGSGMDNVNRGAKECVVFAKKAERAKVVGGRDSTVL